MPVDFDEVLPQLTIAPAERMDLLIDFSALAGRRVRLVNRGKIAPGVPDPATNVPFPQVMEFRVRETGQRDGFELPEVLSGSFRRYEHGQVEHGHRLVVLTVPGTVGGGGHPEIWEMAEVEDAADVQVPSDGVIQVRGEDGTVRTYRRISRTFNDGLGFTVGEGAYEQWSFLNLGGPTHPMHIHLADFQVMGREAYELDGFDPAVGGTRSPWRSTMAPRSRRHRTSRAGRTSSGFPRGSW